MELKRRKNPIRLWLILQVQCNNGENRVAAGSDTSNKSPNIVYQILFIPNYYLERKRWWWQIIAVYILTKTHTHCFRILRYIDLWSSNDASLELHGWWSSSYPSDVYMWLSWVIACSLSIPLIKKSATKFVNVMKPGGILDELNVEVAAAI